MGLSLALTVLAANVALGQAGAPAAGAPAAGSTDRPYTLYSAIPRVPGIKTLIDFNDYNDIIANAKGYVNVRYLPDGGGAAPAGGGAAAGAGASIPGLPGDRAAVEARARQTGSELGMPVMGWVMDPPNADNVTEADIHMMRQLTTVSNLFAAKDPTRASDAYARYINPPAPAAAGGAGAGAAAATPDYSTLPKDRFGGIVYTLSQEDIVLDKWQVDLNSSAATIPNRRNSYAKTITNFSGDRDYLGVRIRFPNHDHNANARVAPAYPVPAFDARGFPVNYGFFDPEAPTNPFAGATGAPTHAAVDAARTQLEDLAGNPALSSQVSYAGVLHNVAELREIVVRVAGRNYRNGVAIRLSNQNYETSEYFLGYLDFVGWRTLRWVNPNYLPADEMEPFRLPLYPTEIPYVAFDSFVVYRNGDELGGDFVTYFDWVKIDYDLAVPATQLDIQIPDFIDIDDDSWWHIIRDRNAARVTEMMREFSRQVDLRRQQLGRSTRHSEGEAPVEAPNFPTLNSTR